MLSLSWCKLDADLLLSCGKDNRALCWNPQTSEIIGEVRTLQRSFPSLIDVRPAFTSPVHATLLMALQLYLIRIIAPFGRQLGVPSRMVPTQPRPPCYSFLLWYHWYPLPTIHQCHPLFRPSYSQTIRRRALRRSSHVYSYGPGHTRAQSQFEATPTLAPPPRLRFVWVRWQVGDR